MADQFTTVRPIDDVAPRTAGLIDRLGAQAELPAIDPLCLCGKRHPCPEHGVGHAPTLFDWPALADDERVCVACQNYEHGWRCEKPLTCACATCHPLRSKGRMTRP